MRRIAVFLWVVGAASTALATPTFFLAPNSFPNSNSTNDLAWQAAVGDFMEWDFDNLPVGAHLISMGAGTLMIDTTLGGLGGESGNPEIFAGSWGGPAAGSVYGTVFGNALLNRDQAGNLHGDFVFTFNQPVPGVGAWLYDDQSTTLESTMLRITEADGTVSTSDLLEAGNDYAHFVEGFLGATSDVGITEARFIVVQDVVVIPGDPVLRPFELDHLQVGTPTIPAPGAILLGGFGAALVGYLHRRRSF